MARPIKETPILYGEDALRFEERMKEKRTLSDEEKAKLMEAYLICMAMLERGKNRKHAAAVPFYLKNGFVPLDDDDINEPTRLLYFDLNDVSI